MCAASLGLTKTSIAAITEDEGMHLNLFSSHASQTLVPTDSVVELAGYDIKEAFFEPVQNVLDQCKSAKALSRKLIKRIETLQQDSSAIKAHLLPQMKDLTDHVAELVNFGISVSMSLLLATTLAHRLSHSSHSKLCPT